jgi:hypothetical protein
MDTVQEYKLYNGYINFPEHVLEDASFQRNIIEEHVDKIINYIHECCDRNAEPSLGCIELAHFNGRIYVIDGQHRLAAFKRVWTEFRCVVKIHTFNYFVYDYDEIESIFRLRNKNYEVPSYIKKLKGKHTRLLKDIERYLMRTYPRMISVKNCNRPALNVDRLIRKIMDSGILNLVQKLDEFIVFFNYINEECRNKMSTFDFLKKNKISEIMLKKMESSNFYLGYDTDMKYLENLDLDIYRKLLNKYKPTSSCCLGNTACS